MTTKLDQLKNELYDKALECAKEALKPQPTPKLVLKHCNDCANHTAPPFDGGGYDFGYCSATHAKLDNTIGCSAWKPIKHPERCKTCTNYGYYQNYPSKVCRLDSPEWDGKMCLNWKPNINVTAIKTETIKLVNCDACDYYQPDMAADLGGGCVHDSPRWVGNYCLDRKVKRPKLIQDCKTCKYLSVGGCIYKDPMQLNGHCLNWQSAMVTKPLAKCQTCIHSSSTTQIGQASCLCKDAIIWCDTSCTGWKNKINFVRKELVWTEKKCKTCSHFNHDPSAQYGVCNVNQSKWKPDESCSRCEEKKL